MSNRRVCAGFSCAGLCVPAPNSPESARSGSLCTVSNYSSCVSRASSRPHLGKRSLLGYCLSLQPRRRPLGERRPQCGCPSAWLPRHSHQNKCQSAFGCLQKQLFCFHMQSCAVKKKKKKRKVSPASHWDGTGPTPPGGVLGRG